MDGDGQSGKLARPVGSTVMDQQVSSRISRVYRWRGLVRGSSPTQVMKREAGGSRLDGRTEREAGRDGRIDGDGRTGQRYGSAGVLIDGEDLCEGVAPHRS